MGEQTVSWYRGPLVPVNYDKPAQEQEPVRCSDELLRYDPETGEYVIPHIIYADAYSSETVAYADLVFPDTTYLERWDCISLLDRPICTAEGPAATITTISPRPRAMAPAMAIRLAINSFFSEIPGAIIPLIKSWEIAEEIASKRPAAVDSAAARPPAATRAITQLGSFAISGLASTMMSRSTLTISFSSPS